MPGGGGVLTFPFFVGATALAYGFKTANVKYMITGAVFLLLGFVLVVWVAAAG